jgi:hypothetical protein
MRDLREMADDSARALSGGEAVSRDLIVPATTAELVL